MKPHGRGSDDPTLSAKTGVAELWASYSQERTGILLTPSLLFLLIAFSLLKSPIFIINFLPVYTNSDSHSHLISSLKCPLTAQTSSNYRIVNSGKLKALGTLENPSLPLSLRGRGSLESLSYWWSSSCLNTASGG